MTQNYEHYLIGVTNYNGIPFKIFVECKRLDPGNPVSVDIVRSLYGVHSTRDGPNKSVLVTPTYFSSDARDYAITETRSEWELQLCDMKDLEDWINSY